MFRLEKFLIQTEFVELNNYEQKLKDFKVKDKPYAGLVNYPAPVGFKEIKTVFGKCFFLHNKQYATTEQKIQGWKIYLNSNLTNKDIVWQVYLGYHGLEYPTFSDVVTHEKFLLRPRTETFINYALGHDIMLPHRGYFQQRQFCSENDMFETITCSKECFLESHNVSKTKVSILKVKFYH